MVDVTALLDERLILLVDIGYIIVAATIFAYLARILKQPMIPAYVLAGVIIGPSGFGLITNEEIITTLAELGITFLLFMVGLEIDFRRLKDVGRVSVGCGLGQIIITFTFGFLLAQLLGFVFIESFYIAFAMTISSTMIVIKLLSDKNELETLHGRISLGVLLIQDVAVIMVLATLMTVDGFSASALSNAILTGVGLVSIAIVIGRFVLPPLLKFAARSIELLFLTSLSWCFIFSGFAHLLGFSIAIGAFLAGVSLASFPYNLEIIGRIRSLRDFFATIFFVSLGMEIIMPLIKPTIIFSLFVLIGTPLIMMTIASLFGYGKRTSLLTALSLAQISEFSLILASQGLLLGHISSEVHSLITFIAVVTITVSSYFIIHSNRIYRGLLPLLGIFEKFSRGGKALGELPQKSEKHIIVCGCHRMGYNIVRTLQRLKKEFLVVDYNPEIIKSLMKLRVPCIYGDFGDTEILKRIDLKDAEMVISTVPDEEDNLLLITETKRHNPNSVVIVTANSLDGSLRLYDSGADYVILPNILAGERTSTLLEEFTTDISEARKVKEKHILKLEKIKDGEILERYEPDYLKDLKGIITGGDADPGSIT